MLRLTCGIGSVTCLLGLLLSGILFNAPAAQAEVAATATRTPTPTRTPTSTRAPTPTRTPTPTRVPPQAPELLGPVDGAVTTASNSPPLGIPVFSWRPAADGSLYHIEVSNDPGFSNPAVSAKTTATSYTPKIVWVDGVYYWRVQTGYGQSFNEVWGPYSPVRTFTKDWTAGGALRAQLLTPEDGANRSAFLPGDFSWRMVPGAAGYVFQISTDELFTTITYSAETLKPQHTPLVRLKSNRYYWRVIPKAFYQAGQDLVTGAPSDVWSFNFFWDTQPLLLNPPNGSDLPFVPRFQWTAVEAAKEYLLQLATDSDFVTVTEYRTRNTDFTPPGALPNDAERYWRVKAVDAQGNGTAWSEVRRFRTKWNFAPRLLTPANNQITLSYPFFAWEPVPGVETYQIQVDDSNDFQGTPLEDEYIYNATNFANPTWDWLGLRINGDYYWHVRGVDAQGNVTPWSQTFVFRTNYVVAPNPIYPPYYYKPDRATMPVYRDQSIAWPVFLWDTAHTTVFMPSPNAEPHVEITLGPDYYLLEVDASPAFATPTFVVTTTTLGAAPTLESCCKPFVAGAEYYWRVRAFRDGVELGFPATWRARFDPSLPATGVTRPDPLPFSTGDAPTLTFPPMIDGKGFEAVGEPPVLGWLPVVGADHYYIEVSHTPDFTTILDRAHPLFAHYVPFQGTTLPKPMPRFGTFWWRVRAEDGQRNPLGGWSEARYFNLSVDMVNGNPIDLIPPGSIDSDTSILVDGSYYLAELSYVTESLTIPTDGYDVGALHVMIDRAYEGINHYWVMAFGVDPNPPLTPVCYGIYVDTDHRANNGANYDPRGNPITSQPLYQPEYALYVDRSGSSVAAYFYTWNAQDGMWQPPQELIAIGGHSWYASDIPAVQLLVPYSALDAANESFSGSLALTLFSTSGCGGAAAADIMRDSAPQQGTIVGDATGSVIDAPAFVSDMLMPLTPFDTPLSNPITQYDMPALRWRTPVFDSIDGYQVEVARDIRFSQRVELWDSWENLRVQFFALLPSSFQSSKAYADNESYYWRVRVRHERFGITSFDWGPWSPPMRFKLDSRTVGNPRLSTGDYVYMTPTFEWERVEAAAGYRIQIDDDANFSSPFVNSNVDGTSYTPDDLTQPALKPAARYYWRIAIRRADGVIGRWTTSDTVTVATPQVVTPQVGEATSNGFSFVKASVAPTPISPVTGMTLTDQPTLAWGAILTPTAIPRMAAPRYRVQIDDDPNFGLPDISEAVESTAYTPPKGKSLADGQWHWRVALLDAANNVGPYSQPQSFAKSYPPVVLITPTIGSTASTLTSFVWTPVPGAAFYRYSVADNETFVGAKNVDTPNCSYTPTDEFVMGPYFWRVQMFDQDRNPGPTVGGHFVLGNTLYLPMVQRP